MPRAAAGRRGGAKKPLKPVADGDSLRIVRVPGAKGFVDVPEEAHATSYAPGLCAFKWRPGNRFFVVALADDADGGCLKRVGKHFFLQMEIVDALDRALLYTTPALPQYKDGLFYFSSPVFTAIGEYSIRVFGTGAAEHDPPFSVAELAFTTKLLPKPRAAPGKPAHSARRAPQPAPLPA